MNRLSISATHANRVLIVQSDSIALNNSRKTSILLFDDCSIMYTAPSAVNASSLIALSSTSLRLVWSAPLDSTACTYQYAYCVVAQSVAATSCSTPTQSGISALNGTYTYTLYELMCSADGSGRQICVSFEYCSIYYSVL